MALALQALSACAPGDRRLLAAPSNSCRLAAKPFKPVTAAPARRRRPLRPCAALSVDQQPPAAARRDRSHETDVVIIGSGIGGGCPCRHRRRRRRSSAAARLPLGADRLPPAPRSAGLCCAALLARYGYGVTVLESHYHAGGAAHSFEIQGYSCDAGPSFFAGLSGAHACSGCCACALHAPLRLLADTT